MRGKTTETTDLYDEGEREHGPRGGDGRGRRKRRRSEAWHADTITQRRVLCSRPPGKDSFELEEPQRRSLIVPTNVRGEPFELMRLGIE